MTDKEINAAIAEVIKWPIDKYDPPNFCVSLDAMHEAEKHLPLESWPEYISLLIRHSDEAVHASARQRAEAFLRFYGKW
jgi:hypothetical protein